jgi:hypothetical protein
VGGFCGEQLCELAQVDAVALFERDFADPMLFNMVLTAEADRPAIRRLKPDAPIGVPPDMGALDRTPEAAGNAAMVAPYPRAVSGALANVWRPGRTLKPVREL